MVVYTELYNTIAQNIFGGNLNAITELFTILTSLTGCAVVIAIPFAIVFVIINVIRGSI